MLADPLQNPDHVLCVYSRSYNGKKSPTGPCRRSDSTGKETACLFSRRGSARIFNVEHVLGIHPDNSPGHLDPLKGVATKALSYLIGVYVEGEGERLLVVPAEHDHARHQRESTSMGKALRTRTKRSIADRILNPYRSVSSNAKMQRSPRGPSTPWRHERPQSKLNLVSPDENYGNLQTLPSTKRQT